MAIRKQEVQPWHAKQSDTVLAIFETPARGLAEQKGTSWVGSESTTLACRHNMEFVGAIERTLSPGSSMTKVCDLT